MPSEREKARDFLILREREIRELLDPCACIEVVERAFAAYSGGRAELPSVIHLDVPESRGEIHVKAGHLHGGPCYAVKMVSGFPGNADLGWPTNDGMVVAFDAATGAPVALLLDNGFITDQRTAAAGAVAARHLAREDSRIVAVVGTGNQAPCQLAMLAQVRHYEEARIWGRDVAKASRVVESLSGNSALRDRRFAVAQSIEEAVAGADIVITVTASRAPLVMAQWLKPGTTVIAVGSDAPDKQELDIAVLANADRVVADSISQCLRLGEIHHAVERGAIAREKVTELGDVIAGRNVGRSSSTELIVCDLTGVGVQDVAAATLVFERATAAGRGERIAL